MASYSSSDFKNGLKVLIDGEPFNIIDTEFHKPGKGQAFNKLKLKNLKNGKVLEKTIKIGNSLEKADVQTRDMQFLYSDGEQYHFMDSESYEQIAISRDTIGEVKIWLKEESVCNITLWNDGAIGVEPPNFIESRIIKTDPGLKGDTAQGGVKPAEIETGANIKVPLFIDEGEIIKVDTRTGDYVSRVKGD